MKEEFNKMIKEELMKSKIKSKWKSNEKIWI
jgi:hypothetical protein